MRKTAVKINSGICALNQHVNSLKVVIKGYS